MKDLRDETELKRIEKLFAKGLEEASKDPERIYYINQRKEEMIEPWEDALEIWRKNTEGKDEAKDEAKGKKKKAANSDDYRALRTFKAAVQEKQQQEEEQD